MRFCLFSSAAIAAFTSCSGAIAQVLPDRADPALVTRSLPNMSLQQQTDNAGREIPGAPVSRLPTSQRPIHAKSIRVAQTIDIPATAFDSVTAPYAGRDLSVTDLRDLAGAVANLARQRGYIFATASIPAQPMQDGSLSVELDEGRVDAVRSLGVSSVAADRLLSKLATHVAVTRQELDRVLLLVGDLPGTRVIRTRYARENGFGILLVTIATDKVSLFAQADNRGTDQIGPWRATELVSFNGALRDGDQASFLFSQTPHNPREFEFVSANYATLIRRSGGTASISGFYGATHAGGELGYLDLSGKIAGGSIGYSAVLRRSPTANTWLDVNFAVLSNRQFLLSQIFRDDFLTTLSGTLRNRSRLLGGDLRSNLILTAGLPLPGVTHMGSPLASRSDGDARFVTVSVEADWTRKIAGPLSLQLTMMGQAASRPLLATAEMSLGGPALGRAYDYSERSGDQGVGGSTELQWDLIRLSGQAFSQLQAYSFVDGGIVMNMRGGDGGGTLASAGLGVRLGWRRFSGSVEAAYPLNADRLDSRDRSPRISARLSVFM